MDRKTKAAKRSPLSDCTNAAHLLSNSTSSVKPKAKPKPKLRPNAKTSLSNSVTSIGSSLPNQQPQQFHPNPETNSSQISEDVVWENFEHLKTYSRRNVREKRDKGKEIAAAVPSSCPPVGRIRNLGDQLRKECDNDGLAKACLVPHLKSSKKRRHSMPEGVNKRVLPQDFIEKQRAYFAEIDAFDLQEEEVSENELE